MITALGLLGAGCIGFGVFPYLILHHVAEPDAGGLTDAGAYAKGMLSAGNRLPIPSVSFASFSPAELLTVAATVIAGLLLAAWYIRVPEPRPVAWLRALHTDSVNDYASYLTVGGIITAAALLAR
jgi:multicomponent Na+:H+ antiporter subunit D